MNEELLISYAVPDYKWNECPYCKVSMKIILTGFEGQLVKEFSEAKRLDMSCYSCDYKDGFDINPDEIIAEVEKRIGELKGEKVN